MNKTVRLAVFVFIVFAFTACNEEKKSNLETEVIKVDNTPVGLVEDVLTKEQQESLSPDDVIKLLKDGNIRFYK